MKDRRTHSEDTINKMACLCTYKYYLFFHTTSPSL